MAERRRRTRLGHALFSLLDVPALAVLVVGLAAAVVPPQAGWLWWMQLVAIGLPYAAWTVGVLTLVPLANRWWGLVAAHALLVGWVVARAWPGSVAAPSDRDVVLMSFNVPQTEPHATLADSAAAFATRVAPDFLGMQDTWVYHNAERRLQAAQARGIVETGVYGVRMPARLNPREGWQNNGMGTPVMVRRAGTPRVAVVRQDEIELGTEAEVSLALRSEVRLDGRPAVIYNLHLRSFGEPKPWRDTTLAPGDPDSWRPYVSRYRDVFAARGREADLLARRIEAETLPVVVMGDFNATADNWAVRRIARARAGRPFTDAYRAAGGWQWGRTYHARRPLVRIDFVFADPDAFVVTGARTHPVGFSDHRPVEVRLRWRDAPAADSTRAAPRPDAPAGR